MLMMNSHILTQEFEVFQPHSVAEAVVLLAQYHGQVKVLAGGTDLLVNLKLERTRASRVVSIGRLTDLRHITADNGLRIGALATFYDVQVSDPIKTMYRALHEAARTVSGTQIKVMGSIGGNLCNASPAADAAPPLLVFDARVKLVSADGVRQVPLTDFFLAPGQTILTPTELLTDITLPPSHQTEGSAFVKLGRVGADIAKISVAARLVRDRNTIVDCKIALGSVAPTPLRAYQAERLLVGQPFSLELLDTAARVASREIRPISDVRSTARYRVATAPVLVRDALRMAWQRAEGDAA
jgi:CO/xanthine dehydrogenase FAD-binding subunit